MRLSIVGFLFLCLLVSPLLVAADPANPGIRTGTLEIVLDSVALSFLPVDTSAVREGLCNGNGYVAVDGGTLAPRGECDLQLGPPPPHVILLVTQATLDNGSWHVSLQPVSPGSWPGSTPVDTPCGQWDISMILDPEPESQPVSGLTLEPSATDPTQGVFAGVVKLAVRYHFANRNQETSFEQPAVVPLELTGHWATVPDGGPNLGEGASNLVLFGGVFDKNLASHPACGTWGDMRHCPVCVKPTDVVGSRPPHP